MTATAWPCFLLPSLRGVLVRLEGAQPGPSPSGAEVFGISAACVPELPGHVQERAEQGDAVVVQQLHQVGLEDETAQLDQVSGALASCLDPVACVGAGGIEAVTFHHQPPQPCRCRLQLCQ